MATFRVAQTGHNASTDPVQDMLIDSNYQTMLVASQGSGTINVSATANTSVNCGSSLGFIPSIIFIGTNMSSDGANIGSAYSIFSGYANYANMYFFTRPFATPGNSDLGIGDPYVANWGYTGTAFSASYMYYVYYLPSQEASSTASNPPPNIPPYINVAKTGGNALTDSLQNLAWTSQVQSMQIMSQQTYTAQATVAASSTADFAFPHNLGITTPFNGIISNYTPSTSGSSFATVYPTGNYNFDLPIAINSDCFGMDDTNFYYGYVNNNLSNSVTIDFTLTVFYFIQPV